MALRPRKAEREGFKPPVPVKVHLISNQAHSITLTPLRLIIKQITKNPATGRTFCFAEREGFKPPVPVKVHLISNQAHSITLTPLLKITRRRGRDSNPRYTFGVYTLSRRALSTTQTPLLFVSF